MSEPASASVNPIADPTAAPPTARSGRSVQAGRQPRPGQTVYSQQSGATAPPTDDLVPWPISSTGPMYVWNPAATTGPLSAITNDDEE